MISKLKAFSGTFRLPTRRRPSSTHSHGSSSSVSLTTSTCGSPVQGEPMNKARAREYVISCGAALFNMRLAIRVAGHNLVMWLLPDPTRADPRNPPALLASVEIVTERVRKPTMGSKNFMRRSSDVTRTAGRTRSSRHRFPSSRPWKTLLPRKAPTFGSSTATRPGGACAGPPELTPIRQDSRITFLPQITGRLRRTAPGQPEGTSGATKGGGSSTTRN